MMSSDAEEMPLVTGTSSQPSALLALILGGTCREFPLPVYGHVIYATGELRRIGRARLERRFRREECKV